MIENENYICYNTMENIHTKIDKQISAIKHALVTYSDDPDQVKAFNAKLDKFEFMKEWLKNL